MNNNGTGRPVGGGVGHDKRNVLLSNHILVYLLCTNTLQKMQSLPYGCSFGTSLAGNGAKHEDYLSERQHFLMTRLHIAPEGNALLVPAGENANPLDRQWKCERCGKMTTTARTIKRAKCMPPAHATLRYSSHTPRQFGPGPVFCLVPLDDIAKRSWSAVPFYRAYYSLMELFARPGVGYAHFTPAGGFDVAASDNLLDIAQAYVQYLHPLSGATGTSTLLPTHVADWRLITDDPAQVAEHGFVHSVEKSDPYTPAAATSYERIQFIPFAVHVFQ